MQPCTKVLLGAIALTVTLSVSGRAETAPCAAPQNRQFDFWVGDWEVTQPDGTVAGTNRVEIILGGCVLQENWESANGKSVGHSFNLYARDGKWHQTWVDNSGLLLELVGGLEDGRMVNEMLVQEGLAQAATVPPDVRYADRFRAAQREAQRAARGMWGG